MGDEPDEAVLYRDIICRIDRRNDTSLSLEQTGDLTCREDTPWLCGEMFRKIGRGGDANPTERVEGKMLSLGSRQAQTRWLGQREGEPLPKRAETKTFASRTTGGAGIPIFSYVLNDAINFSDGEPFDISPRPYSADNLVQLTGPGFSLQLKLCPQRQLFDNHRNVYRNCNFHERRSPFAFFLSRSQGASILDSTPRGNVGIGTTSPGQILTVNGTAWWRRRSKY